MKKTIQVADLFCGADGTTGGLLAACQELNLPVEIVGINHWDIAIETGRTNHPQTRHINDELENVDPRKIFPSGKLRLMVASPECFPAGTLILTDKGLLPIEQVGIGMRVLTHRNRWRPVTATIHDVKDTVILRGYGHYGLEVTENHPFYATTRKRKWDNPTRRYTHTFRVAGWIRAASMLRSYWATPTKAEFLPVPAVGGRGAEFTTEFWWMVGRWLGDGTVRIRERNSEITIVCGKHEADQLEQQLGFARPSGHRAVSGEYRWRRREIRTAELFECAHQGLARWLVEHFGKLAHGKTVPAWALTMPVEWRAKLLEGYMSADGHEGRKRHEATTTSRKLAIGLRLLAESLGHRVSLYYTAPRIKATIEGRPVKERPQYRVMWRKSIAADHEQTTTSEGHSWMQVKEITTGRKKTDVYNLSVADDESYVADGITVHNCTHFSNARGGKPMSKQSRSTIKYVLRWVGALDIQDLLIENVREFLTWGPLHRTHSHGCGGGRDHDCPVVPVRKKKCHYQRPIDNRKGVYFRAFIRKLRVMGYKVEHRLLIAADYGDATSRKRLFIRARKGKRPIKWPAPTHGKSNLFGQLKPYRTAREIIDWTDKGQSIFNRKKPLSPNTMRRIMAGFKKFSGLPFILPNEGFYKGNQPRSLDDTVPTITQRGGGALIEPFIVKLYGQNDAADIDAPLPTVTAGGQHLAVVQPVIDGLGPAKYRCSNCGYWMWVKHDKCPQCLRPLKDSSFIIQMEHNGDEAGQSRYTYPTSRPLPTIGGAGRFGLAQPFVLGQQSQAAPRSTDEPLPTIANAGAISLVEPFVLAIRGGDDGYLRSSSVEEPVGAITRHPAMALVEPFIVPTNHGQGDERTHDIDKSMPTITSVDALGLAEPYLVDFHTERAGQDERVRSVDRPMQTVAASPTIGLAQPYIVKFNGTAIGQQVNEPLGAVTGRDRFALAVPVQNGVVIVDILFRMLQPRELGRAHSFDDNYEFVGTREEKVKQIGGSVPKLLAQALCRTALS